MKFITKLITGNRVGTKALYGVIDPTTLDALPLSATDNADGTATLKIDGEFTATIDPATLAKDATLTGVISGGKVKTTPDLPTGAALASKQDTQIAAELAIRAAVEGATPAGENHTGQMGGHTVALSPSSGPVCDTSIYASGDLIGGLLTFANAARIAAGSGTIQGVVIGDLAKQDAAIDIVFFNANPDGTTFTDQAPLDIADADIPKIIGVMKVLASDYSDFNDNSVATKAPFGLPFKLASGTSIYACLVCRGTPTYASASDLTPKIKIYQD